jgi:hypothetical protein
MNKDLLSSKGLGPNSITRINKNNRTTNIKVTEVINLLKASIDLINRY